MKYIILTCIVFAVAFSSCKKDDENANTTNPVIESLTTDKNHIQSGGNDPAILTCVANGGSLEYLWEVDLGDIFPLNDEGSKVRFTGSECCLGEKTIKCTVSNNKGSIMDTVNLIIDAK